MQGTVAVLLLTVAVAGAQPFVALREANNRVHDYNEIQWQTIDVSMYVIRNGTELGVVAVAYKDADGMWKAMNATFRTSNAKGREEWSATLYRTLHSPNTTGLPPLDMVFAVSYTTSTGAVFWDNNSGKNYVSPAGSGELIRGSVLVDSVYARKPYTLPNGVHAPGVLAVGVFLQNYAYEKTVRALFTTDEWNTSHTANLQFTYGRQYGYSFVTYPNIKNVEYWTSTATGAVLQTPTCEIQLAVVYDVNGMEYVDTNDGAYYRVALCGAPLHL